MDNTWYKTMLDVLERVTKAVIVVFTLAMLGIVLMDILIRYTVIQWTISWGGEAPRFLMIWGGYLGATLALREKRHVGLSFFVDRVPTSLRGIVSFLGRIYVSFFLIVLVKEGFSNAVINLAQASPAMQIPMFFPYLSIPVSGALMLVYLWVK